MEIMLDKSPKALEEWIERHNFEFWQLQTPLSRRKIVKPYGLDNGCFAKFEQETWKKQVEEARSNRPVFVCLPDIVGDARRTLDLWEIFSQQLNGLPKALVLQDGIGNFRIPWDELDAVFVGGSDAFKLAPEAINACKTARMLGKWVHVGRVNTSLRVANWKGLADSIDGSGISKYTHMMTDVLKEIRGEHGQIGLL